MEEKRSEICSLDRQVPHGVTIGDSDSWEVLDGFCRRHLDDKVSPNGARKIRFSQRSALAPEVPPMDPYPGFEPFSFLRLGNGTIEYKCNTSEES